MKHQISVRTLAAGLAALMVAPVIAAQQAADPLPGVRNYTRLDATIGCAGGTPVEALRYVRQEGFVSVINFRLASEEGAEIERSMAEADALGLKYIHLPFSGQDPDLARVDEFLAAIQDESNLPAYIHCASANRVGAMWLIKRVLQDGWDQERALAEAAAIGLTSSALREFALDYVDSRQSR